MNYSDSILENKAFNLFKQGLYYIVLSIVIILAGCLVLVYGFHFRPYNVLSDSMYPIYRAGDLVVVQPKDNYVVGDILKFDQDGLAVTHRCIAIFNYNSTTYYVCHGDNVQNVDGSVADQKWEDDVAYINENVDLDNVTSTDLFTIDGEKVDNVQVVPESKIEGIVVTSFSQWGTYSSFIQEHNFLIIAIVVSIWCVVETIQNELDMKRSLRLL